MIYLDSSVVFSLHYRDGNTPAALALVRTASAPLLISSLCEVESVNAFSLRVFRNEMTTANMSVAVRDLEVDIRSGTLLLRPFPEAAFARARTLAQSLTPAIGVRTADLLHVAAAIELGARSLYTFDRRQHKTAEAAGLIVNPLP
ncbi:MAG: type II toxin-antitoxin system VapC family toxin [Terracidiphilus sp.]